MAEIAKLTKRDGTIILPTTRAEAVILTDGSTQLSNKLTSLDSVDATKAPIANPTFTGTVSGVTASMVGLGNVTNESKSTMFTSPNFTGTPTISSNRIISDSASTGTDIYYIWSGTQVQYDAIGTKDANTLYFIIG